MYRLSKLIIPAILLVCCSCLTACKDNPASQSNTAVSGEGTAPVGTDNEAVLRDMEPTRDPAGPLQLEFEHHVQNNTLKPAPGQIIYYHYVMRTDQETVRSSHTTGQYSYFEVPKTDQATSSISPMLQGLLKMSIGDSLTVIQSLPDDAFRPEKHENANILYYDLSLRGIMSKKQFREQMNNK